MNAKCFGIFKGLRVAFLLACALAVPCVLRAEQEVTATKTPAKNAADNIVDLKDIFADGKSGRSEPTYINSQSLTLKNQERVFEYAGNVEVKHGDMTLHSDFLDGKYNDKNQIEELVARKNVVMTKGDKMKAKCERAVYNARTRIITLMDNPELEQSGSTLAADAIKVFLDENRSIAEGQVRVKITETKGLKAVDEQGKK